MEIIFGTSNIIDSDNNTSNNDNIQQEQLSQSNNNGDENNSLLLYEKKLGSWNLEGSVFFRGKPCPPNTPNFKVPPCSGPYPGYELVIYSKDNNTIAAKNITDSNGNFKLLLIPGNYFIKIKSGVSNLKRVDFAITEGNITRLHRLVIDTGIR